MIFPFSHSDQYALNACQFCIEFAILITKSKALNKLLNYLVVDEQSHHRDLLSLSLVLFPI